MIFKNEKEVDDYINSLSVEQLKKIVKKQAMWYIEKEKSQVYKEGTFGHLLEKHCDSPIYCSIGFEIYSNEDKKPKLYYDFDKHKPFAEIAKVFEDYLNCKIIKVAPSGKDGRILQLNSGFGGVYKVLLEM